MPRHSHDDLLRALGRSELAPVYYLHGTEDILKEEVTRAIVDQALQPHERDFNFDQRVAAQLDAESLHSLINTLPMLAERRVVVIRDVEAWKKKASQRAVLLKYLENPSPDTVLILVEGAPSEEKRRDHEPDVELAARAYSVDLQALEPARVIRWLGFHAKRLGVRFAEGAAEHLATAAGYDLGTLRAELEKLGSLSGDAPITREQVGDLVGIRHGETLEDWVEATLGGNLAAALALTPQVLGQAGMSGVRMVTALGTALIGLRLARALYDKSTRGPALERALFDRLRQVRPFGIGDWKVVTRNWANWAPDWPGARLRAAVRSVLQADMALKGTRVSDEGGVLTGLVLEVGGAASRRHGAHGPGQGSSARERMGAGR